MRQVRSCRQRLAKYLLGLVGIILCCGLCGAGILGLNIFGKESYHPNALGQALIEQSILKQTHNLADTTPVAPVKSPGNHAILHAPKTGRIVNNVVPDDNVTARLVQPGKSMTVQASGSSDRLKANAVYFIHVDGPGGAVIGIATSDAAGNISSVADLPGDAAAGRHTIDITGENQTNELTDITQPIYVPVSDNDADGDGISNVLDTCPAAVNGGQDSDQDGIDDSCDAVIGSVPPSQDQSNSSGPATSASQPAGQAGMPRASAELSGSSGAADAGPSSLTAGFEASDKPVTSGTAADRLVHSASPVTRAVGVSTMKPTSVTDKLSGFTSWKPVTSSRSFKKIRVIKWLVWILLLPFVIWCLVLLGLLAKRLIDERGTAAYIATNRTHTNKHVSKSGCLPYNKLMIWVRKGFVHFLSLVLLISLVSGAFAVSANSNLTHPKKLETWLNQSNFYTSVVTNVLHNAQQSASNDTGAGRVSLGDPTFQQAVRSVFTPQLLQQYTNTILSSNYAWLEGKTTAPQFTIDLTPAKQKLAKQVGQTVETRLTDLNLCSGAQLAQLQTTLNTDPLSIPCQLPTLSPQAAGAQATAQITGSSDFLNNPVITAHTLNPNGDNHGQPYYQKLSKAPALYKWGQRLPWIYSSLALLSILGIIFIAPRKRRGIRRVGIVVLEAGIILVAVKFVADAVFNHLEKRIFNNSTVGQLQQSLTTFLHHLEVQLVKVEFWFGIAFLIVGVLLLGILWFTRNKSTKPGKKPKPDKTNSGLSSGSSATAERPPLPVLKQPPRPGPNRPKPPRLIQ